MNNCRKKEYEVLKSYITKETVAQETIEKYQGKVPEQLIEIWKTYGYGTMLEGYLKVINPDDYRDLLDESYFMASVSIPIMATAFGDIIVWKENKFITLVQYRYNDFEGIGANFHLFLINLMDEEYLNDELGIKKYRAAAKKYGVPEYDECFCYVPLLGIGGKESINNLKKGKIREHIALIVEFCGGV